MSTQSLVPSVFTFTDQAVRVVVIDDSPWFVAADVCAALTIGNSRETLNRLDEDEKGVSSIDTLKGSQDLGIINESGLYSLVLGSRKPEAKRFKKWVTAEVLPAIRKTGSYGIAARPSGAITPEQRAELTRAVQRLCSGWHMPNGADGWVYNHLRQVFDLRAIDDMSPAQFPVALQLVASKNAAAQEFATEMHAAKDWFAKAVLGGGEAWTPAIKSRITRQLKARVTLPERVDWKALAGQSAKKEPLAITPSAVEGLA